MTNIVQIILPPKAAGVIEQDLEKLTRMLDDSGHEKVNGILGGAYGYGCEYKNDVFEMFPYYWGDCTCGFDKKLEKGSIRFQKKHHHAKNCFHEKFKIWDKEHSHIEHLDRKWARAANKFCRGNGKLDGWCGIASHCDCGFNERFNEYLDSFGEHPETCPSAKPNFRHFGSNVKIWWYKYVGRDMEFNNRPTLKYWKEIFESCVRSINEAKFKKKD